jgi:hypothetical protein
MIIGLPRTETECWRRKESLLPASVCRLGPSEASLPWHDITTAAAKITAFFRGEYLNLHANRLSSVMIYLESFSKYSAVAVTQLYSLLYGTCIANERSSKTQTKLEIRRTQQPANRQGHHNTLKLSTMACLAQGYRQVFIVHMEQITIHCKA